VWVMIGSSPPWGLLDIIRYSLGDSWLILLWDKVIVVLAAVLGLHAFAVGSILEAP
jgi:hypothetical protein